MSQPICVGPGQGCMYCSGDYGCTDECKCPGCLRAKKPLFVVSRATVFELAQELHRLSGRMTPGGLESERPGFRERYIYRAEQLVQWFRANTDKLVERND